MKYENFLFIFPFVTAYARIRMQFKTPIAEMGGVQEPLARIAAETFIITSSQMLVILSFPHTVICIMLANFL